MELAPFFNLSINLIRGGGGTSNGIQNNNNKNERERKCETNLARWHREAHGGDGGDNGSDWDNNGGERV